MNCIKFESAVERAVEQREPLDPAMLEHARTCPDCQLTWDLHQRLDSAIAVWRIAEPPTGLVDSVLHELASPASADIFDDQRFRDGFRIPLSHDVSPDSHSVRSFSGVVAAKKGRSSNLAIAAMSICLLFATVVMFQTSQQARFDFAQRQQASASLDLPGTLTAVLSDLKLEYTGIAIETSSAAREMVNAIPHPETVAVLPEAEDFQLQQAPGEMARIWKPIGSQVGSALGFLWKAVPSEIPSG